MLNIDLEYKDGSIDVLLATHKQTELAARRALNKTIRFARSLIARNVTRDIGIKVKPVRNSLRLKIAKNTDLEAVIHLRHAFTSAIHAKKSTQHHAQALKGHAGYSKPFEAIMPNGHKGIYRRRTKARLKIDKQYIMWHKEGQQHMQQVEKQLRAQLQKTFEHELNFILNHVGH